MSLTSIAKLWNFNKPEDVADYDLPNWTPSVFQIGDHVYHAKTGVHATVWSGAYPDPLSKGEPAMTHAVCTSDGEVYWTPGEMILFHRPAKAV